MKIILAIAVISLCSFRKTCAQTFAKNEPSKTTTRKPIEEGPNVWGVFHGRVACQPMATVLNLPMEASCEKLKWGFVFLQDPVTKKPTRYRLEGSLYRESVREGNWALIKGTSDDPTATVIQLDPGNPEKTFSLLKGDENVLFVLDKNKNLMVGSDYLSFTFNRVRN
jgi:hypothetical protein